MKALKHISFILLAAFYIASACTYSVNVLASGIPASGADTIFAHNNQGKELPQKLSIQRRHIPLVNDIPCPCVHLGEAEFPPVVDEQSVVFRIPSGKHTTAYYYTSLCDRAPPVA